MCNIAPRNHLGVKMQVVLYRHFSSDGQLLYVGVSKNGFDRLADHVRSSDWRREIASITLQWFDDLDEALDAECAAINTERPLWNVVDGRCYGGRPLAGEAHLTNEATKPWEALGMSRRTWYRRRKESSKNSEPGSR